MKSRPLAWFILIVILGVYRFAIADVQDDAKVHLCESNMRNIKTAISMYQTDHGMKYPASLNQLAPNYLKFIPKCLSGGGYQYERTATGYTLSCSGQHPGLPAGYPRYSTTTGFEIGPGKQTPYDHCQWLIEQADNLSTAVVTERRQNPAKAKADAAQARQLLEEARKAVPTDLDDYMKKATQSRIDSSERMLNAIDR